MEKETKIVQELYGGKFKIACYPDRNKNRYEILNGICTKVYEKHYKKDLQAELKERGLDTKGKKDELVERLYNHDLESNTLKDLQEECQRRQINERGPKEDIIARLRTHNEERVSPSHSTGVIDKSGPLMWWALNCMKDHVFQNLKDVPYTKSDVKELVTNAQKNYRDVRDEAAEIGTYVHDWAEEFAKSEMEGNDRPPLPTKPEEVSDKDWTEKMEPQIVAGIEGFVDWYNEHNVKFLEVESIVYSIEDNFWGRFDAIAEVDGDVCLIDYKTSKGIYLGHKLQTNGYWKAKEEEVGNKFDKALILHFQKDAEKAEKYGTFDVHEVTPEDHEKDYPYFRSTLHLTRRVKAEK